MIGPEERRHLMSGPRSGQVAGGVGTVDVLACEGNGTEILSRAQAVLLTILEYSEAEWPAVEEWRALLPSWFVAACGEEMRREDAERWLTWWRTLGPADKVRAESERRWTLADWLYWLNPLERQWFWWDAKAEQDGTLRVTVEVSGWPTALGALDWLLRAAGAVEIVHEESWPG
ncbi:hypothetical protein [Amycolatopsis sp. WGS_07]|uniref:hypothetical protein n=1 Tax=Amycolatopsis sp. WGS_07 TaxID=3076764 RepID=UPI003872ACE2